MTITHIVNEILGSETLELTHLQWVALYLVYMLCCMCVCVSFHEHELVCESGTGILFQIHTYPRHPFGEAGGSPQNSVLRVH